MIVRAATIMERRLLAHEIGLLLTDGARGIVAMDGDAVRGGVLYDGWTDNGVVCHMATSSPIAWRRLLPAVFTYPFNEVGRGVLIGHVKASNEASVRLTRHLGFTEACRVKDGAAVGDDLLIFTMRREGCGYLKEAARAH